MKPRVLAGAAVVAASLVLAAPAPAAPLRPPDSQLVTITCAGGVQFTTVTIEHNMAVAAQLLDGRGVFILTRVVAPDGSVAFAFPGQAGKTDVTGCSRPDFPGFVGEGFFAPGR